MISHPLLHDMTRTFFVHFPNMVEHILYDIGYKGKCNSVSTQCKYPLEEVWFETKEHNFLKTDVVYGYGGNHVIFELKTGNYNIDEIYLKYSYARSSTHLFIVGWSDINEKNKTILDLLYRDSESKFRSENPFVMMKHGWLKTFDIEYFLPFIESHYDYLSEQVLYDNLSKKIYTDYNIDMSEFKRKISDEVRKLAGKYKTPVLLHDNDHNPPINFYHMDHMKQRVLNNSKKLLMFFEGIE